MQKQTDRASRTALGRAYHELAALTEQIGNKIEAMAVYRKALSVRRGLAAGTDAAADTRLDLARTLLAFGPLQYETGDAPAAPHIIR